MHNPLLKIGLSLSRWESRPSRPFRRALAWCACVSAAALGCAKAGGLHFEKQGTIPGGGNLPAQIIPAAERDREVAIRAETAAGPISVYVVLEKHLDELLEQLPTNRLAVPLLEKKENVKEANILVKLPAGKECAVVIGNGSSRSAAVTLRIDDK
jgi:ParB-like chromosome segregation protein Spo0J